MKFVSTRPKSVVFYFSLQSLLSANFDPMTIEFLMRQCRNLILVSRCLDKTLADWKQINYS